jgi:hypothetical protein
MLETIRPPISLVEERVRDAKSKGKRRTKRPAIRGAAALADSIMADDVMTYRYPKIVTVQFQ